MAESQQERYKLESKISSNGSFADIWLVTDTVLELPVAVKCPKLAHAPIRRERFVAEKDLLP